MTENAKPKSAYDIAADDLCAVMASSDEEYTRIRFEYGITPKMMPTRWHEEFSQAVYSLRESNTPVHDTTIKERCAEAPLSWILQVMTLADDTRVGKVARENARIVHKEGLQKGTLKLLQIAQEQIASGKPREQVTANLVNMLQTIGNGGGITDVRTLDHADKNRAQREKNQDEKGTPLTGLGFWDAQNIRYEPSQIWWIAGAYKSRKTTLAFNLALQAALNGMSVGMLSKEMSQDRVQSIFEAMLAIGYLLKNNLYSQVFTTPSGTTANLNWISGKFIRTVGANYKRLHPKQVEALDWAFAEYKKLNMRVYDAMPEHGGLSNFASIQRVIGRDMQHDKGKLFFVDYYQLFAESDKYEDVSNLAMQLQDLARSKGITLVILAQRNEESIKGGSKSYSAGVKGGGTASATADYLFITRYKEDETLGDNFLDLEIKHAREDASGSATRAKLPIHPQSGLLLGTMAWANHPLHSVDLSNL